MKTESWTAAELDAYAWGAPPPSHALVELAKDVERVEEKGISLNQLISNIQTSFNTGSGVSVTPENCMRSTTVHAVVTAVSRRISVSPVHVFKKEQSNGRVSKTLQPNHPVEKLLNRPNQIQTKVDYWLDAVSALIRYGEYFAVEVSGNTGPIRMLVPVNSSAVEIVRDNDTFDVIFRVTFTDGTVRDIPSEDMHHVRSGARDFLHGDSPIMDIREAIATEIAVEQYGAAFFGNGALPLVFFNMRDGKSFKDAKDEQEFVDSFQSSFGSKKRFKAMIVPNFMETEIQETDQEKTQLNETRQLLRSIIAGALGVPPHLVGDLQRATFNNVEQQDADFVLNVILPYARSFEAAMERDFFSQQEIDDGFIIRFNLDAALRGDFVNRQIGLNVQRRAGVINANDWRENEGMNPITEEDGGDTYLTESNMTTEEIRDLQAEAGQTTSNQPQGGDA